MDSLKTSQNHTSAKNISEYDATTTMRHSFSHVLAAAVAQLYGDKTTLHFGVGPATAHGFYYDIDFGALKITPADLPKITKTMQKIIAKKLAFKRTVKTRTEALAWAEQAQQPLKAELIKTLPETEKITFYTLGDFTDLCRGPHVKDTSKLGAFTLSHLAGAYWLGDEKRPMLTRIYGLAFDTQAELDLYQKQQQEAKKRDHRKLGRELDLFAFSELVGSGLPLFTPRGTILRDTLNAFSQRYRLDRGYQKVTIPHIANVSLYKTSGHLEKFPEMMRFVSQESGDELALKPVSCPHHSQIFASQPRSYKDLPIKYLETTMVYRDERKGELGGLSRVRAITQDDSHVFCTEDQVETIFAELIESAKDLYAKVGMKLRLRLSFRDESDGYIGDLSMWQRAESSIQRMADKFNMTYFVARGEAAMYGPKMDFMAMDALGREWQLATVQLDYAMPQRFALSYIDQNGASRTPIMIHCALIGSIERFMSVFLEHTAGWLPFWCAPEQLRVLTVNDDTSAYLEQVSSVLQSLEFNFPIKHNPLRYSLDQRQLGLSKKIRDALKLKIPVLLIIGPKDANSGTVSLRYRDPKATATNLADAQDQEATIKLNQLAKFLADHVDQA